MHTPSEEMVSMRSLVRKLAHAAPAAFAFLGACGEQSSPVADSADAAAPDAGHDAPADRDGFDGGADASDGGTIGSDGGPPGPTGSPPFALMSEMYGDAAATAQQRLGQGLLTGVTFHPTLSAGEQQFLTSAHAPFAYFAVPAEANIASCYPSSGDPNAGPLLQGLTAQLGPQVWRLGMPEFDQGGGCWATGRPSMAGLSDADAYAAWTGFYVDTKQLGAYLKQGAQQRGYAWMSVCSFAFCPQYAFDMGSDAVLLERNEDEMSGITPGLAMIRGAAAQHGGKAWGIDISTWRYWSNGASVYSNGRLVTGWSAATFKRNMYIAYMGGANLVHDEAADYTTGSAPGSTLNPLGLEVQAFEDFAVKRHPNRGTPLVPMALVHEHASGFEPKFGEWMQVDSKWYWTNAYTDGDRFFANLLALAYPSYETWGTLPPGAPKVTSGGSVDPSATFAAYQSALAGGADPRPWEPMGTSRWGETFDVITDRATLEALQRYRAVVLATGSAPGPALLAALTSYAQQGGTVVLNARQIDPASEGLAGVHVGSGRGSASSATWLPDGTVLPESPFGYSLVTPGTATVIARAGADPVVTKNVVGAGAVYVTTPDFMADSTGAHILAVGQKLLDTLQSGLARATVQGAPIEYLLDGDGGRTIVTLVNTDLGGADWHGTVSFEPSAASWSVREWTQDTTLTGAQQGTHVVVEATVPAFDVRIVVLDAP
jgi:hypothetical protein